MRALRSFLFTSTSSSRASSAIYKRVQLGPKEGNRRGKTTNIMTSTTALVALLVFGTVVSAIKENDTELTTGSQLKEEFERELNETRDLLLTEISKLSNPGYTATHPASSCKEILQLAPQSPSGHYWISGTDNRPSQMYCDMERSCKGVAGGWMRVASFDANIGACPSGLKTLTSPHRLCARNIDGPGCSTAVFPVQGIKYSQVCGKIIGFQQARTDAFHDRSATGVCSNYVDGISLTHGDYRKHIWTFASALHEHNSHVGSVCPCTNTRNSPPPSVPDFVGNDYFCDTGSRNFYQDILYKSDPLWDGAGCGEYSTCCDFNSPPWFRKEISPPISDEIEMRLCTDEYSEDVKFETLEIYVQ